MTFRLGSPEKWKRGERKRVKTPAAVFFTLALAAFLLFPPAASSREAAADNPPRVVLTFDDGYNLDHRILEFLSAQGINATAFVIGSWAERNPSLLQEMNALGWDICNHTQTHPWLTKINDDQIRAELDTCQAVITSLTGQHLPLFRPPGGFIDARVQAVAAAAGYTPVMWDLDSRDSRGVDYPVQERADYMVNAAHDGSVLLFHFGGRQTYELVTRVVKGLQQRGFCFVTISELYGWKRVIRGGETSLGTSEAAQLLYFADGTTMEGFEEWIIVFNPERKAADLEARYFTAQGSVAKNYAVPPQGRISILVNREIPWQENVSVRLQATSPVVAERSLFFDRGSGSCGGSIARGVREPGRSFYFPGSTTREGFEEYLSVFNPSGKEALLKLQFLGGDRVDTSAVAVPPLGRITLRVNDLVPAGDHVIVARSNTPAVVERAQYFSYGGTIKGASCTTGTGFPRGDWYFAGGTTRNLCDSYLSLYNPCREATWLRLVLSGSDGSRVEEGLVLQAGERRDLFLNSYMPPDIDYATRVESVLPVVVECNSFFLSNNVAGGSCSGGGDLPGEHWCFAEGCTAPGFSERLVLFNPLNGAQKAKVTFILGSGEKVARSYKLPPQGLLSVDVAAEVGRANEVAVVIQAQREVIAERAFFFEFRR